MDARRVGELGAMKAALLVVQRGAKKGEMMVVSKDSK